MAEYIDLDTPLELYVERGGFYRQQTATLRDLLDTNNIPYKAADVRPVVRAVWRRYSPFTDTYECSNCGEQVIDQQFRTNYCPNCGARMEES